VGFLKGLKGALLRYRKPLIWGVLVAYGAWLCLVLPLAGGLWAEELGLSGSVTTGYWITPSLTPTPEASPTASLTPTLPPPPGTSLEAEKTAEGFAEERQGAMVYGVRGQVCVTNRGERPTENLKIVDVVQARRAGEDFVNLRSAEVDLSQKPQLQPGEKYCYPYEITFEPLAGDKVHYRNLARVTITNHSGWLPGSPNCPGADPCPFGPEPKAGFELPTPEPSTEPDSGQPEPGKLPKPWPGTLPTLGPGPSLTPSPTPEASATPQPTLTPGATETPQPSHTLPPTQSASPTPTPAPTDTPQPTPTAAATDTPLPTSTVAPTDTPPSSVTQPAPAETEAPPATEIPPTPGETPNP